MASEDCGGTGPPPKRAIRLWSSGSTRMNDRGWINPGVVGMST